MLSIPSAGRYRTLRVGAVLSLVGVVGILAANLNAPQAREVQPWEDRLRIATLRVPGVIVLGDDFDVTVAATDPIGIREVEITFERQVVRLPAFGVTIAVLNTALRARTAGYHELDAAAIDVNGVRGEPKSILVAVGDHSSDAPAEAFESFEFPRNPFELYERGPLYKRGLPTRAKVEQARVIRKIDARIDRLPVGAGVLRFLNWWRSWKQAGGPQPFDWKTHCGPNTPGVTPNGEVLECWLGLNPKIRFALVWQEVDPGTGSVDGLTYNQWDPFMKNYLNVTFYHYWQWLDSGLNQFPPLLVDPPFNQVQLQDGQSSVTALARYEAENLYIQTVAHSLALEIGGFLPWSVLSYSQFDLYRLFSLPYLLNAGLFGPIASVNNPNPVEFIGYWPYGGEVTPAPPTTTFEFLVDENVIRPTHYDTIARLLKWSREHMLHWGGNHSAENMFLHWQYRGNPPVSRIIQGTVRLNHPNEDPHSWVSGCHGVSFFFQSVLRALNIPVSTTWIPNFGHSGGHRSPVFTTIDRTLSHGDDAYEVAFINIPGIDPSYLPPDDIMITSHQFFEWFNQNNPQRSVNTSRQVYEIARQILPNSLMTRYCDDLAAGLTHHAFRAQSSVYALFDTWYTVQELEAKNLWVHLGLKEIAHDYCPGLAP